jgi:hypothetical protein
MRGNTLTLRELLSSYRISVITVLSLTLSIYFWWDSKVSPDLVTIAHEDERLRCFFGSVQAGSSLT